MSRNSCTDAIAVNEHGESTVHTPGPWHVESGTVICAGDRRLTRTAEAYTELGDARLFWETRANARLMAAAPDLLEALLKLSNEAMGSAEMARECIGNTNANVLLQRAQEARALIAKVKGGS